MEEKRFGPMDQEKYDGADYVCDSCGSEIMIKHTGDGEKHKSLNYTCRCGTKMRLEDAKVAAR